MACSRTRSLAAAGDMSETAHWCPARKRSRTTITPIPPRPIIPICTTYALSSWPRRSSLQRLVPFSFEMIHATNSFPDFPND